MLIKFIQIFEEKIIVPLSFKGLIYLCILLGNILAIIGRSIYNDLNSVIYTFFYEYGWIYLNWGKTPVYARIFIILWGTFLGGLYGAYVKNVKDIYLYNFDRLNLWGLILEVNLNLHLYIKYIYSLFISYKEKLIKYQKN